MKRPDHEQSTVSPRSRTARHARLVVRAFHEKPGSIATHWAKSTGC
ncbi:MAG: hypothetical protein KTR25_20035 [Myxococcales bacterium]|nr:hypothetical protein [Myxococcales bacterium]